MSRARPSRRCSGVRGIIGLAALAVFIVLAWLSVFLGAGTGMNPIAMTSWLFPCRSRRTPGLVALLLAHHVFYVGGNDGCDDAAVGFADGAALCPRRAPGRGPGPRPSRAAAIPAFASGYLAISILFSLLAVMVQWGLERLGALSAMMSLSAGLLSGSLLIAAGLYQLTPFKAACLTHCRTPASFLAAHWRQGVGGAWRMGLTHGLYCLGCCAVLMGLLFVGGVMNLIWVAALTLLVAIEKLAPFGAAAAKTVGAILIAGGVALVLTAW